MKALPQLRPKEILGVSHLVFGAQDIECAEGLLTRIGYTRFGEIRAAPNPPEKSPFVARDLAQTFTMKLMVSEEGGPPIELLRENSGDKQNSEVEGSFDAILGPKGDPESQDVLSALSAHAVCPLTGFREIPSASSAARIVALVVHCRDLEAALSLWHAIGFREIPLGSGMAKIKIRGLMPSNHLTVYLVADRPEIPTGYLDQAGIVCLSLLCQDADRLRDTLGQQDHVVSHCFTLAPFGTPLRIFFARNTSGEIYEFLSVGVAESRIENWKVKGVVRYTLECK